VGLQELLSNRSIPPMDTMSKIIFSLKRTHAEERNRLEPPQPTKLFSSLVAPSSSASARASGTRRQ
jgi:hypothetical protein